MVAPVHAPSARPPLGVYVHFPWCRKLCPYCDFAVEVVAGEPPHDAYLAGVLEELARRAPGFEAGRLVSIYLGGGTPARWRPDCIAAVVEAVAARFGAAVAGLEVTLEANPTDCTPANLAAWHAAGVGRLSIGVQSLAADELVVLGRDHRLGDGAAAVAEALAAGGFEVSADFILGAPVRGRRPEAPPAWVAPVVATAIGHLSVYELTVEPRTAFGKRARDGRLVPHDEDTLLELYVATDAALAAAGFEHYEISSYARPGKRAVHNSLYWRGAAYLGLGAGAASLELLPDGRGRRQTNPRRSAAYLAAPGAPAEVDELGAADLALERAWLGLRTRDGVAEAALDAAPGAADALVADGLADRRAGRICPTMKGFLMADRIAADLVRRWRGDGAPVTL